MINKLVNDRYEIIGAVGEGATGQVFRAFDVKLNRNVILKFLANFEKSSVGKRFAKEAYALSKLNHPNIVKLYEYIETPTPFIVLEDVGGRSLKSLIDKEEPLSPETCVEMAIDCLTGLHAAHEADIVHRDIKPANVIITSYGGAKLIDFGLILDMTGKSTRMTAEGCVAGTLAYMAPEVLKGLDATATSDVYSLGTTLFEALTTHLPYEHVHLTALLHSDGSLKILDDHWPNSVDTDLREIVSSFVSTNPSLRPQSAKSACERLQKWQSANQASLSRKFSVSDSEVSVEPKAKEILSRHSKDKTNDGKSSQNRSEPPSSSKSFWPFAIIALVVVTCSLLFYGYHRWKLYRQRLHSINNLALAREMDSLRDELLAREDKLPKNKLKRLGNLLGILLFGKRLGMISSTSKEASAYFYLIQYGSQRKKSAEKVAWLYEQLIDECGLNSIELGDSTLCKGYTKWMEDNDLLERASAFFLKLSEKTLPDDVLPGSLELSRAYLDMCDKQTVFKTKTVSDSKILTLFEKLLPKLEDKDFSAPYARYISLVCALGGLNTEEMLQGATKLLEKRPASLRRPRETLCEGLCFTFNPKPESLKLAMKIYSKVVPKVPPECKNDSKIFAAYLTGALATAYSKNGALKESEDTMKLALTMAKKVEKDTPRAKLYDFLLHNRGRSIVGDEIPMKKMRRKFKAIKKLKLEGDELFLFQLCRYSMDVQNNKHAQALKRIRTLVKTAPHRFRPNMLGRSTGAFFLRTTDILNRKKK